MLIDNPMPPGAVSDAIRCILRSREAYERASWWRRLWWRVTA